MNIKDIETGTPSISSYEDFYNDINPCDVEELIPGEIDKELASSYLCPSDKIK